MRTLFLFVSDEGILAVKPYSICKLPIKNRRRQRNYLKKQYNCNENSRISISEELIK